MSHRTSEHAFSPSISSAHSVELESILLRWLPALPFLHSPIGPLVDLCTENLLCCCDWHLPAKEWEVPHCLPFTSVCSHELISVSQQLVRSLLMASTKTLFPLLLHKRLYMWTLTSIHRKESRKAKMHKQWLSDRSADLSSSRVMCQWLW